MANTTFKGPVTSLNGFIGGPNKNAGDTQQGGKTLIRLRALQQLQMELTL